MLSVELHVMMCLPDFPAWSWLVTLALEGRERSLIMMDGRMCKWDTAATILTHSRGLLWVGREMGPWLECCCTGEMEQCIYRAETNVWHRMSTGLFSVLYFLSLVLSVSIQSSFFFWKRFSIYTRLIWVLRMYSDSEKHPQLWMIISLVTMDKSYCSRNCKRKGFVL